jgi:hypothetical protein
VVGRFLDAASRTYDLAVGPDPLQPGGADVMFTVVPVLIVIGFVFVIGSIVYRSVRMARRGQNPLTLQEDVAMRVLRAPQLQRARTKAERLDELDTLRALGRISEEELAAARAKVLSE